jgi:hypothetical protein
MERKLRGLPTTLSKFDHDVSKKISDTSNHSQLVLEGNISLSKQQNLQSQNRNVENERDELKQIALAMKNTQSGVSMTNQMIESVDEVVFISEENIETITTSNSIISESIDDLSLNCKIDNHMANHHVQLNKLSYLCKAQLYKQGSSSSKTLTRGFAARVFHYCGARSVNNNLPIDELVIEWHDGGSPNEVGIAVIHPKCWRHFLSVINKKRLNNSRRDNQSILLEFHGIFEMQQFSDFRNVNHNNMEFQFFESIVREYNADGRMKEIILTDILDETSESLLRSL